MSDPAGATGDARSELLLRLNLLTPIQLCRTLVPGMVERGRGAVVNISSMAGITWTPWMAHYSASKAGLGFYSETLRYELKDTGVHVVSVYPGPVSSAMEAAAREQQQQLAQAILLAVLALMLIEALSANWIGLRQAGRAG